MINESIEIIGSGGGSPTSVEPSLKSQSLINFLFLLSEGEIAGFPPGDNILRYIYANNILITI